MANILGDIYQSLINNVKTMTTANGFFFDWSDPNPVKSDESIAQTVDGEAAHTKPMLIMVGFEELSPDPDEPDAYISSIRNEMFANFEITLDYDSELDDNHLGFFQQSGKVIQDLKKRFNRTTGAGLVDPVTAQCTALSALYASSSVEYLQDSSGQFKVYFQLKIKYNQNREDPSILG